VIAGLGCKGGGGTLRIRPADLTSHRDVEEMQSLAEADATRRRYWLVVNGLHLPEGTVYGGILNRHAECGSWRET
jgi:hypothetical protein